MDITLSILLNHYIGTMTHKFKKEKEKALRNYVNGPLLL
ncbi:hypothetical protein CHCC15325_0507 [Bacillus licheniformis]|nr:hypothetical protein B4092_2361 [Bacillus licheniformis]TWJ96629.1 hypothetical protein CHCC20493_1263 [Bacillus licheniformis]TWK61138.1 hypothetical protein CHCC20344_2299 [Bacillus licheniformis]TWL51871.1 hypothetical protein CHCC15325_0507 [Bacillus licheniformis]TWM42902.1 hypothetical protein CHCC14816_3336 [Bacillus licheniformis]